MSTPCTITREYGVTWLDGRPHIGITKLLAAAGLSEGLVKHRVAVAVKNYDKLKAQFESGEISEQKFDKLTQPWELMQTSREKMREGGNAGREVHSMVQAIGEGNAAKIQEYKEKAPNTFAAFDSWLVKNEATIELAEVEVFHGQLGVCGRFDALIRTPKGKGIYEVKTTNKVYYEATMQASFYWLCDVQAVGGMKSMKEADYTSVLLFHQGVFVEHPVVVPPSRIKTLMAYRTIFEEIHPDSPIFKVRQEAA